MLIPLSFHCAVHDTVSALKTFSSFTISSRENEIFTDQNRRSTKTVYITYCLRKRIQ
jgi:hypothetical protein